ncbi:hypothetical protein AJ87_10125 [Rhizobium yanglingense]|nr:hypothetical protein AJ87_10125 [Rhizobium yanglingense]
MEIVFYAALALLLFSEPDAEVTVEVAAVRRRPGKGPAHPPLEPLQLCERCARDRREGDIVVLEMDDDAVESVGDRRAGRAAGRIVGTEHEVIDEKLRAAPEKIRQLGAPFFGLEPVFLVDPNPGQFLTPQRQCVAAPCQLLFILEQVEPCRQPLFACSGYVCRHRSSPMAVSPSQFRCGVLLAGRE